MLLNLSSEMRYWPMELQSLASYLMIFNATVDRLGPFANFSGCRNFDAKAIGREVAARFMKGVYEKKSRH